MLQLTHNWCLSCRNSPLMRPVRTTWTMTRANGKLQRWRKKLAVIKSPGSQNRESHTLPLCPRYARVLSTTSHEHSVSSGVGMALYTGTSPWSSIFAEVLGGSRCWHPHADYSCLSLSLLNLCLSLTHSLARSLTHSPLCEYTCVYLCQRERV